MLRIPTRGESIVAVLALSLTASASEAPTYYPLAKGNYWVYQSGHLGEPFQWTVTDYRESRATVDVGRGLISLQDRGSEVDIEMPGEGFVLHYRFEPGSTWQHRDWYTCSDGARVSVELAQEPVVTVAGTFSGCLVISYIEPACMDAGKIVEYWAEGVGLVKWEESTIAGPFTVELIAYCVAGSDCSARLFRRGDANGSGRLDIADPVWTLFYLFLAGPRPPCFDAADANDDGRIDVSDPIATLYYLFVHGAPLPEPADRCGFDETPDRLECASFPPCAQTCESEIAAIAAEVAGITRCTSVVRLDYLTRRVLGWRLTCLPSGPFPEENPDCSTAGVLLEPKTSDEVHVFYQAPGDFGGVCAVHGKLGYPIFGGTIVWMGQGDITYPRVWRPASELAGGCRPLGYRPEADGYDLESGGTLAAADVEAALDAVWETALPEGLVRGHYFFGAAVLSYPRSVGPMNPVTAQWIVILSTGYLE